MKSSISVSLDKEILDFVNEFAKENHLNRSQALAFMVGHAMNCKQFKKKL